MGSSKLNRAIRQLPRPPWLDEQPGILALLGEFVRRLDNYEADDASRLNAVRIEAHCKRLRRHDEAADHTWELLRALSEAGILAVRLDPKRHPYDAEYAGAKASLCPGAEPVLRDWLARPRELPEAVRWRAAVAAHADCFADGGAALAARPVRLPGRTAEEVIAAFAALADFGERGLTLRQLSARAFWGHSKFLDNREPLLLELFPNLRLVARPLVVNVHLPPDPKGILFIENQDSYTQAIAAAVPADLTLVYAAGFRGSAARVRSADGVSLHYHGDAPPAVRAAFERWWFSAAENQEPLWFWGDLDFSGMAILKALRQRFGEVRAWEPGYAPMLQWLEQGGGHAASEAGKEEQRDCGETGCAWADWVLLPAIRAAGRFVDQEVV